jgi:hypothetical protein
MPIGSKPDAARGKRPQASSRARYCTICGERLSTYNRGPNCYAHTVREPWRGPVTRPATGPAGQASD